MQVLWDQGPATVAEVRERLAAPLAYTTVLTVLRKLEAKGYVARDEVGRAHRYRPAVDRDVARTSALRALARKLFNGSAAVLLTHAVQDHALSEADLARIRRLIDAQAAKARKP
jgi:predicted transcriptional regulator